MQKPRISIIASIGKNRELGKDSKLIWRIPDDLRRVKKLTTGHPIIMGRKTFDSIGHPLPNRTNIVISRNQVCIDGCLVFDSIQKGIAAAMEIDDAEVFIFGGGSIYKETIAVATRLYLTIINEEDTDANVFFPDYSAFVKIIESEVHTEHTPPYTFVILER